MNKTIQQQGTEAKLHYKGKHAVKSYANRNKVSDQTQHWPT